VQCSGIVGAGRSSARSNGQRRAISRLTSRMVRAGAERIAATRARSGSGTASMSPAAPRRACGRSPWAPRPLKHELHHVPDSRVQDLAYFLRTSLGRGRRIGPIGPLRSANRRVSSGKKRRDEAADSGLMPSGAPRLSENLLPPSVGMSRASARCRGPGRALDRSGQPRDSQLGADTSMQRVRTRSRLDFPMCCLDRTRQLYGSQGLTS